MGEGEDFWDYGEIDEWSCAGSVMSPQRDTRIKKAPQQPPPPAPPQQQQRLLVREGVAPAPGPPQYDPNMKASLPTSTTTGDLALSASLYGSRLVTSTTDIQQQHQQQHERERERERERGKPTPPLNLSKLMDQKPTHQPQQQQQRDVPPTIIATTTAPPKNQSGGLSVSGGAPGSLPLPVVIGGYELQPGQEDFAELMRFRFEEDFDAMRRRTERAQAVLPQPTGEKQAGNRWERVYADDRKEVHYANGLRKIMWPDGATSVFFTNGDRKVLKGDGAVSYYYKATDSYQCTLPSQEQFFKFPTGQLERHYPSGAKSIVFSNGTLKRIHHDGSEVIEYVTKRTNNQHAG